MFFYDEELNDIEYGLPGSNARGAILFTIEKTDPNSSISTDHPDYSIHPLGPSDVTRFTSLVQDLVQDESGNVSYKPSTEIVLLIRGEEFSNFSPLNLLTLHSSTLQKNRDLLLLKNYKIRGILYMIKETVSLYG